MSTITSNDICGALVKRHADDIPVDWKGFFGYKKRCFTHMALYWRTKRVSTKNLKRVVHLALYGRTERVRKKNFKRAMKEMGWR